MNHPKRHTVILILVLAAAIAIAAFATAQAEGTPKWMLSIPEPGPELPVALGAEAKGTLALSSKSGTSTVEISCTGISLDKAVLEGEGKSTGTALFSGCKFFLNKVENKNCVPKTSGLSAGNVATEAFKGLLTTHEGKTLDQIQPVNAGKLFANLELGAGFCPIGEEVEVTGTFYAKDAGGLFEVEEKAHLLEAGPLTEVRFGGETATLSGTASLSLTGEHLGLRWSGLGS